MARIATATVDPPPPPPKRRRPRARLTLAPVRVRTKLHLCLEWRDVLVTPTGEIATIEHLQTTREAWRKSARSKNKAWRWRFNGFLVTAYRVEW